MWGFFDVPNIGLNREDSSRAAVQVVNLLALTYCVYDLYQNPNKIAAVGMDMFIHTATYLVLAKNKIEDQNTSTLALMTLNVARLGAVYTGVTSSCPNVQMSVLEAAADAALHVTNTITLL